MLINYYRKILQDLKEYIFGSNKFSYIENYKKYFLYPINLEFTIKNIDFYYKPLDEFGIPYKIYRSVGKQYNPTRIGAYALANFNNYIIYKILESQEIFFKCLNWFYNNKEGLYKYNFDWNDIKAPWVSCMAQGEAVSVLLRGYYLTSDKKYLTKAKEALEVFHIPVEEGGVLSKIQNNFLFLEEYPSKSQKYVLNGFLYALIGLSEYILLNKDDNKNKILFKDLLNTLENNIELWSSNNWSYYQIPNNKIFKNYCTPSYHNLQISQLKYINSINPSLKLSKIILKWEKNSKNLFIRLKALFYKIIYRTKFKAQI